MPKKDPWTKTVKIEGVPKGLAEVFKALQWNAKSVSNQSETEMFFEMVELYATHLLGEERAEDIFKFYYDSNGPKQGKGSLEDMRTNLILK